MYQAHPVINDIYAAAIVRERQVEATQERRAAKATEGRLTAQDRSDLPQSSARVGLFRFGRRARCAPATAC